MNKPCETCKEKPAVDKERFCKTCKALYLKEMRLKFPNPERTGFSDERGRKIGRGAHRLSGDADMRHYHDEIEDQQ